jgi:hypothetical protein
MPQIPAEQIEQARSVDLLTYLQTHEPNSIRKSGAGEYCLVEHDSLKISNGRWNWFSRGFGGYSALDFLVKVRGLDFPDAVLHLTDGRSYIPQKPPPKAVKAKPPKTFTLPPANVNNDKVIAYLRGRGIDSDIIKRCIDGGLLYEAAKSHNCVFVGFDGNKAKFACERGTADSYKKDIYGSDKRFSFVLQPNNPNSRNLAVTEAPIDVLSHATIHKLNGDKWDGYRLSLGGVSSLALISFLEQHPEITSVQLCLDNDTAGRNATDRIIKEMLSDQRFSHLKISVIISVANGQQSSFRPGPLNVPCSSDTEQGKPRSLYRLNR